MDKRARRYLKERVQRGIALLDRKVPGWDETVSVESLDLGSASHCVVGQAARKIIDTIVSVNSINYKYGCVEFGDGVEALGLHSNHAWVSHGFVDSDARRHGYGYHDLTEEWCEALSTRRLDRQLSDSLASVGVVEHLLQTVQP